MNKEHVQVPPAPVEPTVTTPDAPQAIPEPTPAAEIPKDELGGVPEPVIFTYPKKKTLVDYIADFLIKLFRI